MDSRVLASDKVTLVIQSFGKEREYRRAVLAILSFYANLHTHIDIASVRLYTDNPHYFEKYLIDLPITYIGLTSSVLSKMRGKYDFLHRIKIAIIDDALTSSNCPILYSDSDSFFISDALPFALQLSDNVAFMHTPEYQYSSLSTSRLPAGKPFLEFYQLLCSREFELTNGSKLKVPLDYSSWNAGIILLHPSQRKLMSDVYRLCEEFYAATNNHASEQYAFSIVLQHFTELRKCYSLSYHYWHRVKKSIADQFLEKNFSNLKSMPDLNARLNLARHWTRRLRVLFSSHYERHKDDAIQYFNTYNYSKAYNKVFCAFLKNPLLDRSFLLDTLYHTRQYLKYIFNQHGIIKIWLV